MIRTALKITNWIVTIFFVAMVLSTFSDLYFPQETGRCIMPQMSLLIVLAFPLSFVILTISFFEIKQLLRRKEFINKWRRRFYWAKVCISSTVALGVIFFIAIIFINEFLPSNC
jgi:uncharacterized membrane protein